MYIQHNIKGSLWGRCCIGRARSIAHFERVPVRRKNIFLPYKQHDFREKEVINITYVF